MADTTRDRLIETSTALIAIKGFNNTGIAEILTAVGVPKGSFYHYFKSKDDLGLAAIDHYGHQLREGLANALQPSQVSPLSRLRAYFDGALVYFEQHSGNCNCLLGNLGQELALQSDSMREAIFRHYLAIEKQIAECLAAAKEAGELSSVANEALLARTFFAAWEGSMTRAKLEQNIQPLRDLLDLYFENLLKP